MEIAAEREQRRKEKRDRKQQGRDEASRPPRDGQGVGGGGRGGGSAKLRGLPRDSVEVRTSKTLSWILRHGAKSEGLAMRPDGYVRVDDLVSSTSGVLVVCKPAPMLEKVVETAEDAGA